MVYIDDMIQKVEDLLEEEVSTEVPHGSTVILEDDPARQLGRAGQKTLHPLSPHPLIAQLSYNERAHDCADAIPEGHTLMGVIVKSNTTSENVLIFKCCDQVAVIPTPPLSPRRRRQECEVIKSSEVFKAN